MSKPVILLVLVALAGIFTIIMCCFLKKSKEDLGLILSVIDKLDSNEYKRKIATYRKDEIIGYLSGFIALCFLVTAFFITIAIILDYRTDIIRDILCY